MLQSAFNTSSLPFLLLLLHVGYLLWGAALHKPLQRELLTGCSSSQLFQHESPKAVVPAMKPSPMWAFCGLQFLPEACSCVGSPQPRCTCSNVGSSTDCSVVIWCTVLLHALLGDSLHQHLEHLLSFFTDLGVCRAVSFFLFSPSYCRVAQQCFGLIF